MARSALALAEQANAKIKAGQLNGKKSTVTVLRPKAGDKLNPEEWARQVNVAWRRAGGSILEAARLIFEANHTLKKMSEWPVFKDSLDIDGVKVSKLLKIGERKAFFVESNVKHAPPCLSTLYTLAQAMDDKQLITAFRKSDIHNNMTLEDAEEVVKKYTGKTKKEKTKKEPEANVPKAPEPVQTEATTDDDEDEQPASSKSRRSYVDMEESTDPQTQFENAVANFQNSIEGSLMYVGLLDDAMSETNNTKLPREVLKIAARLARNLDRVVKQYG